MPEKNSKRAYYTPEELMEVLPLGRTVIYRELKAGRIPSIRLGKRFVIPKAAIQKWLESASPVVEVSR